MKYKPLVELCLHKIFLCLSNKYKFLPLLLINKSAPAELKSRTDNKFSCKLGTNKAFLITNLVLLSS